MNWKQADAQYGSCHEFAKTLTLNANSFSTVAMSGRQEHPQRRALRNYAMRVYWSTLFETLINKWCLMALGDGIRRDIAKVSEEE
jgi:hypothetical protein